MMAFRPGVRVLARVYRIAAVYGNYYLKKSSTASLRRNMMSYALTETAKAVVASAFTFIASGRPAAPSLAVEGLWYDVLGGQEPYDVAISERPVTVSVVNGWTQEARIGWLLNNFQTDERYAAAWSSRDGP